MESGGPCERAAGYLDRRPSSLDAPAFTALAIDRNAPLRRRGEMVRLIDTFLQNRPADASDLDPPQILRRLGPVRGPAVYHWPIVQIDSLVISPSVWSSATVNWRGWRMSGAWNEASIGKSFATTGTGGSRGAAVCRDFFASISAARIYGIFFALGYTPSIAHVAWISSLKPARGEKLSRLFDAID